MSSEFSRSLKLKTRKKFFMKRNIKSRFMRSFSLRFANSNAKLSRSNSSESEFKTSTIEIKKSTLEIETDLWNKLSMSSSTSKQLQNDIIDLFYSQQKSLTSANRKTQYMFSSLDALMLNSHANAHNDKNTINLRNANSQQKEQTQAIVKVKEMKKRKAMKSSQKEVSIEVSTSKCYDVISKEMQIKRLRERIEFAVNQLRQAISEQKETISYSLIYIQRTCNESIENSIQKQIDWLQSQTNNKLKIILQLIQQNAENIKKKINAKQRTKNLQISQKTQVLQTLQIMQSLQKSTQKLTYAQKAAQVTSANSNANTNANVNANAGEWNLIIKKFSSKSQEKSYCERRLIVNLKNENWTLKTMKMRDSMNNVLKKAKIDLRVITIVKTLKRNNITLIILKKYIADILLAQRVIWEHVFDVKSIKKDEKWHKIVIHSLKIKIFNMKIEMKYLRMKLEKYNFELKLIINSIWLSKDENKARKNHTSMILTFKIEAEVQRHLKKRLLTARSTYWTVEYQDYQSNDQCQKCQTFKHLQNKCNRSSRCLYCKRNHQIWKHKCQLSTCKDEQSCNHMISRCCNCQNAHFANSAMCETYQAAQSISSQKDHLVTKL